MKKFALPLAVIAAIAMLSVYAESVQAAGRRRIVLVQAGPLAGPTWIAHRQPVVLRRAIVPVIVPVTVNPVFAPGVLTRRSLHWNYVPAAVPVGTATYVGW